MTSATSNAATTTGARHTKHRRATTRGVSALMYASQQGDVERVRKIIREQSATLLTRDRTGKTPLHYCCTSDNICAAQAADLLVMAAPDLVESHDEDGFTPLHLAVIAGNMPLVTFLLANKADVNAVDNEKHTVVHWAAVCGETAALRAVLAAGAPVSTPDVHGGYPLHYAAQMCGGDKDSNLGLQVLQTLLAHSDVVVSVEDGDGRQPLLWAASAGSAKAVLALIRAGAAVEASDKDGLTALHCAASRGHTDCIDSLLTLCGASPDVIDSNGCTALHYAVTLGHADATALLLAHGADPNRQDRKGRSPAHCGCAKGQFETLKMIGAHGANLWLRNARGDLPLHEAAASGRRDLVRWLLDMRPSQVNARNNDGRCPLHLAALNDNADMCKILLDAGAQVNPILRTSKNTFMTPLDCALQRGFRSTAKYLQLHGGVPANRLGDLRQRQINSGANLQIKDDVTFWGDTSSDSERENGEVTKHSKRVQRKKLSNKYEKKRASLSGSDLENNKFVGSKLESGRTKRRLGEKNQRTKTGGRTDSAASTIDHPKRSHRKTPSGRFDYANEIVINGKTEINIHQTTVGAEEEVKAKVANDFTKEVADKIINEVIAEKEKRPKSAKHSKIRDKSAKSTEKEDSLKKKTKSDRPNSKSIQQTQGSVEQSRQSEVSRENTTTKSTSESASDKNGKNETVPEPSEAPLKKVIQMTKQKTLADQQSLMSNTSEDVEEHKSLIVEAAVHEPPKVLESNNEETMPVAESQNLKSDDKSEDTENKISEEVDQKDTTETIENAVNEETTKDTAEEVTNIQEPSPPEVVADSEKEVENKASQEPSQEEKTNTEITEAEKTIAESEIKESQVQETSQPPAEEVKSDEQGTKEEQAISEAEKTEIMETVGVETDADKEMNDESNLLATETAEEIISEEPKDNGDAAAAENEKLEKEENNQEFVSKATNDETDAAEENKELQTEQISKEIENDTEIAKENEVIKTIQKGDEDEENEEVTVTEGITENETSEEKTVIENDIDKQESTDKTEEETEEVAKLESKEKVDENDITEIDAKMEQEDEAMVTKQDVAEKQELVKADKSSKSKKKKKIQRKKRHAVENEDQPYEIIYKTLGADEDDDITPEAANKEDVTVKKVKGQDTLKAKESISESKSSEDDYSSDMESDSSSTTSITTKEHKSFRVLDEQEAEEIEKMKTKSRKVPRKIKSPPKKQRSRSEENKKIKDRGKDAEKGKRSRIPTPLSKSHLSKSDKYLNVPDRKVKSSMESRVPSLPNINESKDRLKEHPRSESNMSAPLLASIYSDNERGSGSDLEEVQRSSATRRKKVRRKPKTREARSAGSDYESSNVIDSGFEPSPRSSRIPKWKNMTERGVNMASVTQSIQSNIRRYHLERKIFQHLLDLKRMQIRAGQHNEAILVKRAIDTYHQSCASTVGAGRYVPEDYTFKSFEKFLYLSLRKLQRNGADHLKGLPESSANPLLCTQSTHRCMHATHAYTGIPCAAYLPKMDHHTIPKIGFASTHCKPGTGFLPTINPKKAVTLELCHGNDKQIISLPADRLDQNKRYYVTFTVKGNENTSPNEETATSGHRHSKSD